MRLVNGVCVFIAELVEDSSDPIVVLGCNKLSDDPFEPVVGCEYKRPTAAQMGAERGMTYSRAPCFRLSYSLSLRSRCTLVSMSIFSVRPKGHNVEVWRERTFWFSDGPSQVPTDQVMAELGRESLSRERDGGESLRMSREHASNQTKRG